MELADEQTFVDNVNSDVKPNELHYFWTKNVPPGNANKPQLITIGGVPISNERTKFLEPFVYGAGPANKLPDGRYLQVAFVNLHAASTAWDETHKSYLDTQHR